MCEKHLPPFDFYHFRDLREKTGRNISKKKMKDLLKQLCEIVGSPVQSSFHKDLSYLQVASMQKFEQAVKMLLEMPSFEEISTECPAGYKYVFGSWIAALDAAEQLEGGVKKTRYGYMCIAKDGDLCRSLGEKIIDDYMFAQGIAHTREPIYPGKRKYRADWKVGDYFIEYWGLQGEADYDQKSEVKREISTQNKIPLIEVTSDQLYNLDQVFKILTEFNAQEGQDN